MDAASPSSPTSSAAVPDPADTVAGLLDVLALRPAPGGTNGVDVFLGANQRQPRGRVFGGQVLAQALVAASRTVTAARKVHSMHGYFLRAGDPAVEIAFAVERLHDGGSFSTRRVQGSQHGKAIFSMIASFQEEQEGLDHAEPMPRVPAPEDVPSADEVLAGVDHPMARAWSRERPVDVRHVQGALYVPVGDASDGADDGAPDEVFTRPGAQAVWMRVRGTLPDDQALHRAVLGYVSDVSALEPVLRRHGVAWSDPRLKAASLDHALWIHRDVRADEWLLFVQASPSASGARGLGLARIYSRDGVLVATVAQEGMVRLGAS